MNKRRQLRRTWTCQRESRNDQRSGAALLWTWAETAGEDKAPDRPYSIFQYLMGTYKKAEERFFTRTHSHRAKGNGLKWKESEFRLDIWKKYFILLFQHNSHLKICCELGWKLLKRLGHDRRKYFYQIYCLSREKRMSSQKNLSPFNSEIQSKNSSSISELGSKIFFFFVCLLF